MNLSTNEIEEVVREVMARLGQSPSSDSSTASTCSTATTLSNTPTVAATVVASPTNRTDDTLCLTSRVVTIGHLNRSLRGVRRLLVPPGAVVTPAARDLLQDRGIALEHDTPGGSALLGNCSRLTIVAALTSLNPASLVESLRQDGLSVEAETSKCLIDATDRLAACLTTPGALAVVLTPHVAAAVCLANRLPGVRAVSAAEPESAVDAARAVGANLLVVCPRKKTPFQLRRLVGQFAASGPYDCPEPLQARLK